MGTLVDRAALDPDTLRLTRRGAVEVFING